MKKILPIILILLFIGLLSSCNFKFKSTKYVDVYTRDSASGTREGFMKGISFSDGVLDSNINYKSSIVSSNGDMISSIENDIYGIGYVSLTSTYSSSKIKPVSFNGILPSKSTVNDGTYTLSRNFNYIIRNDFKTKEEEVLVKAFQMYMYSDEGQIIISANGGITNPTDQLYIWDTLKKTDPIVKEALSYKNKVAIKIGGSTSVLEIAKALSSSFKQDVVAFEPIHNHTGSSDAYKNTQGNEKDSINYLDIGFLSRDIKIDSSEKCEPGTYGIICKDAIVVIVNVINPLLNITDVDLKNIYMKNPSIIKWEMIS